jgi:site-specific recombinase XerD
MTKYLIEQDASQHTIRGYLSDLAAFEAWFQKVNQADLTVNNLTMIDVQQYRSYLLTVINCSPSTINRRLAALRSFAEAVEFYQVGDLSKLKNIRAVKMPENTPKWLDKLQIAALLREAEKRVIGARTDTGLKKGMRDLAIVLMFLHTGLRVNELVDLTLPDVYLSERAGKVVIRKGKGLKQREIPLNRDVRNALKAWLAVRHDESIYFFTACKGEGRLTCRGVERMIEDLGRDARVEVTPHVLRHTFAKGLVNVGVSLEKVASLLGHAQLETTRIYVIPGKNDLEEAVSRLEM